LRQARKLGALGVVIALVATFGLVFGGAHSASAQVNPGENCVAATTPPGGAITCSFVTSTTVVAGGTLTKTITSPASTLTPAGATGPVTILAVGGLPAGCTVTSGTGTASVTVTCAAAPGSAGIAAGTTLTETFSSGTVPITENVIFNSNGPAAATGSPLPTSNAGVCVPAAFPPGTPIALGTEFLVTCTNLPAATTVAGGELQLNISAPAGATEFGPSVPGFPAVPSTITAFGTGTTILAGGITPSVDGCTLITGLPVNGATVSLNYLCGPGTSVTAGSTVSETVACTSSVTFPVVTAVGPPPVITSFTAAGSCGAAIPAGPFTGFGNFIVFNTATGVAAPAGTVIPAGLVLPAATETTIANATGTGVITPAIPAPTTNTFTFTFPEGFQPTTATLACGGTTVNSGGSITLTAASLTSAATTCVVTPKTAGGANPVGDGVGTVALQSGTTGGLISCDGASVAPGTQACSASANGTVLSIPCGTTAPNGSVVGSETCTNFSFNAQSLLAACLTNPVSGSCNGNFGTSNGCLVVNIQYEVTTANGGSSSTFGNFSICFPAPSLGTLLVGCSPSVIPSNGTLASVCTATFANQVLAFNNGNGLLPTVTTATTSVNAAAFLPGTFTFSSNGEAIFDNGRQQESVPCGVGANISSIGVGSTGFNGFNGFNEITPVTFSCNGAAVLALGNGAAGNAAINVTYTSAVGGFSAVGSTLLLAVPSGTPALKLNCVNPATGTTTIIAGGQGALCTATVADQNGVPLTGLTGAGVTFSVNNPSAATVIPCTTAITVSTGVVGGSCTVTASVIGGATAGLNASTGQTFTTAGGIAQAIVVANPNTQGQTVTVTASIGVFVPPSFLGFLGQSSLNGVTIPTNSALPFNGTGLSVGLNGSSLGFGGVFALPNASSASATLTISGGATVNIVSPSSGSTLNPGCNQVIVTTAANTPVKDIAATVAPASAVISIFRFNNTTRLFQAGFFSDVNAPTDFTLTAGGTETYFICVSAAATVTST